MDREIEVGTGARLFIWGMEDDGLVINADVELVDADGSRWSATVMTLAEIGSLMSTYRNTGECLSGSYFRVPDLLILDSPRLDSLIEMVEELLRTGDHILAFADLEDED